MLLKSLNFSVRWRGDIDTGRIDLSGVIDADISALAPVPPGVILREEWLEPLNLSAYRLAMDIHVPPNRVNAILAGKRAITADTALRLAKYFGTDASSWMNLQTNYDLAVERRLHRAEIMRDVRTREMACSHGQKAKTSRVVPRRPPCRKPRN
ncbi:MAG TPA: HigA family addiction module antitoxin [Acidocella sp.]|jgi:addiction module HigA family antidote|uniref:HigA family addiction module antitoxin n=1 Tax=Acidocella sp. TaxID=50710 RepID=UPI002CAF3BED|nr:HigA family addiction module antitoxin [Acidocella sp.]HVE20720.1 HigA family addiction module antitoxin [Acidocella sp.]